MFKFTKLSIPDVLLIEPQVFWDDRGFFLESYNKKDFVKKWISTDFVQDNHSKSKKWTFRWLHFQTKNTQAKLVRVTKWSVFDVWVDLRKNSPTFWQFVWEVLSAENKKQLFIPKWFAHWFLVLEDDTEFLYKCDDYYSLEFDWWIIYNDEKIWINWWEIIDKYDISEVILSEKDKKQPGLDEFSKNNPF